MLGQFEIAPTSLSVIGHKAADILLGEGVRRAEQDLRAVDDLELDRASSRSEWRGDHRDRAALAATRTARKGKPRKPERC